MTAIQITLIIVAAICTAALLWSLVRAWRYHRDNPDKVIWPYCDETGEEEKLENIAKSTEEREKNNEKT